MSPEQKPFVLYAAPAGIVVLVVGFVVWSWSGTVGERTRRLERAHADYADYYLGDGERLPEERALAQGEERGTAQREALDAAERMLVVALPEEFRTDNYNNAGGLLQRIMVAIDGKAQRRDIKLPADLPLRSGFNPDVSVRSRELAQLYLLDQSMRVMLNGATRIESVELAGAYRDPASRYAVFTCDFRLRADFRSCYEMIRHFAESAAGIGLRACDLRPVPGSDELMEFGGTVSLLCVYDERWELPEAAIAADGGEADDARNERPRRRTGRGR